MRVNKGQVLIVTLFVLGSSMIFTYMLLMPVLGQSLKVQTLLNSFRALSNAETGIEVGNYYALKGNKIFSGNNCNNCAPIYHSPNHCNEFESYYIFCLGETISDGINFQSHIDVAIEEWDPIKIKASRNISQGVYKNTSRILQFIFIPQ